MGEKETRFDWIRRNYSTLAKKQKRPKKDKIFTGNEATIAIKSNVTKSFAEAVSFPQPF